MTPDDKAGVEVFAAVQSSGFSSSLARDYAVFYKFCLVINHDYLKWASCSLRALKAEVVNVQQFSKVMQMVSGLDFRSGQNIFWLDLTWIFKSCLTVTIKKIPNWK